MAKEYIEREAAISKIQSIQGPILSREVRALRELPAADVVEVVHGRWEPKRKMYHTPNAKNYTCSKCGLPTAERWHYCPNCGARMDGE